MKIRATVTQVLGKQNGVSKRTGEPWESLEFVIKFGGSKEGSTNNLVLKTFNKESIKEIEAGRDCSVTLDFGIRNYQGRTYNDIEPTEIVFDPKAF